jgi:hypothetical protein
VDPLSQTRASPSPSPHTHTRTTRARAEHVRAFRMRGTGGVAPVYTTFIRVYVNATGSSERARAHVLLLLPPPPPPPLPVLLLLLLLLLLRLLLSLTTNLPYLALSVSLISRAPVIRSSRSRSRSRPRARDQTRRFSETAGIKDRGATDPACRCPSRVTRVGGTVDLSLPRNRYGDIGGTVLTAHSRWYFRRADAPMKEPSLRRITGVSSPGMCGHGPFAR